MSAKAVFSADAPKPPPFLSQALTFGNLVFCSGQVATNPNTGALIQGSITDRTVRGQLHNYVLSSLDAHSAINI
jgi:enamine deaminase RidA (YjgF/YER057c/UK114 family)